MAISFYGTREVPYGCFSNFSHHGFDADGLYWPTAEHFFQAQKFVGHSDVEAIRNAASAKIAATMGRDRRRPLRPDWEHVKDAVMRQAVLLKFQRHASIRAVLLATDHETIIEASPIDAYWGAGADGTGKNMLGVILMEVRDLLRGTS